MSKKQKANSSKNPVIINDIAELLGHALALEVEATERYADLAEIMEAHNNSDVSRLFEKMSEIEKLHVEHIIEMTNKHHMTDLPEKQWKWESPEGPETTNPEDLHYLMQPYHALQLALVNEQRAYEYYTQIAETTENNEVRSLAAELATEEEEHVALVKVWLNKYPKVDEDWDYDDDPPLIVD